MSNNCLSEMSSRKKVKILFVSHASGLHGSERSLLHLLKGLDKQKYEPLVLLPEDGQLRKRIEGLGIEVIVYPVERWIAYSREYSRRHFKKVFRGLPGRVRFLSRLIEKEKIDLVYSNSIVVIDDAIAAKLRGVPHIRHIRNFLFDNPYLKPYLPMLLTSVLLKTLSCRIIVVSNAVKRNCNFDKPGSSNGKVKVVYNGIDIDEFRAGLTSCDGNELRAELGLAQQTKIVALIGRCQDEKGIREFIEAVKIVTPRFSNTVFVIIGQKYKRTFHKFEEMVTKLGLQEKIYFTGFRENLFSAYRSMDVLVSASWIETFGMVIAESMIAGKPVVATRCGGPEELVADGETGYLVPAKSSEELAGAIARLLDNPQGCEQMGRLGRERASKLFRVEQYVSSVQEAFDKAMEQTRPRFNREELTEISRAVFKSLPKLSEQALREVFRKIRNTGKRRASRTAMPFETSSEKCVQSNV